MLVLAEHSESSDQFVNDRCIPADTRSSLIKTPVRNGADITASKTNENTGGYTALHIAVYINKPDLVKTLLDSATPSEKASFATSLPGFDIDARSGATNHTPLMLAVQLGHLNSVEVLLAGADDGKVIPDITLRPHDDGPTLLHLAVANISAQKGKEILTRLLTDNSAFALSNEVWSELTPEKLAEKIGHKEAYVKALTDADR